MIDADFPFGFTEHGGVYRDIANTVELQAAFHSIGEHGFRLEAVDAARGAYRLSYA